MAALKIVAGILILASLSACALMAARGYRKDGESVAPFKNLYTVPEDKGDRVAPTYFFRRAWVQLTRDLTTTDVPPTVPLELRDMQQQEFAVAWLGHASMLVRAGQQWVLIDPVLSGTAGPVQGFGPARLTPLPLGVDELPHIDVVLISHDHYDHLDLETVRRLAKQSGGAPRFFAGTGLAAWFSKQVGAEAMEFGWWDQQTVGGTAFRFVPAQHNSGRTPFHKNSSLWGGWVIAHAGKQFYFPGDTAFVSQMFEDIRKRIGPIHLAALPIGAYQPRALMRFEHLDPDDALEAHHVLQAEHSFGVHWGTFQLGDEEPFQPAVDLATAMRQRQMTTGFGLMPIGGFVDIGGLSSGSLLAPSQLRPARAGEEERLVSSAHHAH